MDKLVLKMNNESYEIEKDATVKDFIDSGICPTCFDRENNNLIYGKKDDLMLQESIGL